MSYRPSKKSIAKQAKVASWAKTPDEAFEVLGASREKLAAFEHALLGTIVLPGDPDYDAARRLWLETFQEFPKIIAYCEAESDVRSCLAWARRTNLWVTARSGGHSTAGYSAVGDMIIDLSRMSYVQVDPAAKRAVVGAGTNFGTLNHVLDSYKLHVPGGVCQDVSVGGYAQGGGYGFTSREFGLNCDNVVAFRMMLRDGRTVLANESQNADLFWSVRGGTGNNFGILIDISYRLHHLWQIWAFGLLWRLDEAAAALRELQENYMRSGASPKLGYHVAITHRSDHDGQPMLMIRGTYNGTAEDGRNAIETLLKTGSPDLEIDATLPYAQADHVLFETPRPILDIPADTVMNEDKQSGYIDRLLEPQDWQEMLDYYAETSPKPYNLIIIEPYGGAINAVAQDACAFRHRDVYMDFYVDTFWIRDEEKGRAVEWLNGFMDLMEKHFNGYCYQNYPRAVLADYKQRYWGDHYHHLLWTKNKYDPIPRFFYYQQGICRSPDDPGDDTGGRPPPGCGDHPIVYEPHSESPPDDD